MRFLARSVMTAALMMEGTLLGFLFRGVQLKNNPILGRVGIAIVLFLIGTVYPLRAAVKLSADVPEFRARAELWDLRDAYIIRHAALGETDLIVSAFSGEYNIKELDLEPAHWVNVCAAAYYGVQSISAVTMPAESIVEYLNE
jgi:hypothetical protein